MTRRILVLSAGVALLGLTEAASAHLHFTINTNPTPQGRQTGIETYDDDAPDLHGNYAQFPNTAGQLTFTDGTPLTLTLDTLVPGAQPFGGYLAGEAPTLTTDLYVDNGSGNLTGGDFWYEIHSVTPVAGGGGSPAAQFIWTIPANADENPTMNPAENAIAGAATREGRSLDLGYDEHLHGQTLYVNQPGLYSVGLIGWDKNGIYLDSPVTSFRAYVPIPGDANLDGKVDFGDLLTVAQHYGTTTGATWQIGSFYGDGAVNFSDLLVLAQHYGQSLSAPAASTAAVPEPACLAALGCSLLIALRRRNARQTAPGLCG